MKKLIVNGGRPLSGEITISGAKNSTVALIPAAILLSSSLLLSIYYLFRRRKGWN